MRRTGVPCVFLFSTLPFLSCPALRQTSSIGIGGSRADASGEGSLRPHHSARRTSYGSSHNNTKRHKYLAWHRRNASSSTKSSVVSKEFSKPKVTSSSRRRRHPVATASVSTYEGSSNSTRLTTKCSYGVHKNTGYSILGLTLLSVLWIVAAMWVWSVHFLHHQRMETLARYISFVHPLSSADPPLLAFTPGPGSARSGHLDNAKIILIGLVMLVHCDKVYRGWPLHNSVMAFINPFCTRAFGFISGIVAQANPSVRSMRALLVGQVIPLLSFCLFVEPALVPLAEGQPITKVETYASRIVGNLLYARGGASWYLFALICWRLWAWVLLPLRPVYRLVAAMLLASVCGYGTLDAFKLSQAIAAFPVYVFGQIFPYQFVLQRLPWTRSGAVCGLCVLSIVFVLGTTYTGMHVAMHLPLWSWSGDIFVSEQLKCGYAERSLVWMRGLFRNVLEVTKCLTFLFLVCPRGDLGSFTRLGAHTLYPFLLHYSFAEAQVRFMNFPASGQQVPWYVWSVIWCAELAYAFLVTTCLATFPVRRVFSVFLEPKWLFPLLFDADGGSDDNTRARDRVMSKG